jgi:hypothetical protein
MHWLAMKLREVIPATELFSRFRQQVLDSAGSPAADELIRELRRDAQIMRGFDSQPVGSDDARSSSPGLPDHLPHLGVVMLDRAVGLWWDDVRRAGGLLWSGDLRCGEQRDDGYGLGAVRAVA